MPRPLVTRLVIVVVIIMAALFALSRIDASKAPKPVEKIVPDSALAK